MIDRPTHMGIVAGGGSLPREIADCAAGRGHQVSIVAIDGEADQDMAPYPVTVCNWGQIGGMIRALKAASVEDLVIAGRVKRPDLLHLKPDLGFFRALAEVIGIVALGGDDNVLRAVVRFFERRGFRVIGVPDAAPELVIGAGVLTPVPVPPGTLPDVRLGFAVVRALGPHDIGQAVVVSSGRVEAIEAAEGTDGMLRRLAGMRQASHGSRCGVLIKRAKPGQELRVDLPAIGPGTVRLAAEAGLAGVAVEAGHVISVERASLVAESQRLGVFVLGAHDSEPEATTGEASLAAPLFSTGASRIASEKAGRDAVRGAAVLASLAPLALSAGVVVARGHVLSVEAGEGLAAMLGRAEGLRQWGGHRWRRRRGVAVVARVTDLDATVIAAAQAAGLEGIAVLAGAEPCDAWDELVAVARKAGLFLAAPVTCSPSNGKDCAP